MKASTQISKQVALTTSDSIRLAFYNGAELIDIMEFTKSENTLKSGKLAGWLCSQIDRTTFQNVKLLSFKKVIVNIF